MRLPVSLTLALAALAALAPVAATAQVPAGYEYSDQWLESFDGTQLHAGVFLPDDHREGERHPVLMTITPYTAPNGGATSPGNLSGPVMRFPELFSDAKIGRDRWAYVQLDVRGFGGSGGCFQYYGPNELRDTKASIEWAADQPWSAGKVGLVGKSYDAAQEVLALASRPRGLAAAVIQAPGLSGYTALWMNRTHYGTGRYGTTVVYTAEDLGAPQNSSTATSPEYAVAASAALTSPPTCRSDAVAMMNLVRDRDDAFWQSLEVYRGAAGATTPVLWTHGFYDANTKPVHLDIWSSLRGPRQAWFGQFTHVRGHEAGVGRKGFMAESMRFLDRHVRGVEVAAADPPVTVQQGDGKGAWRAEDAWPPADAQPWAMALHPGSYADSPESTPAAGAAWSATAPLPHASHLAGEALLRAEVRTTVPEANVVAHLYDVDPSGVASLISRGSATLAGTGAQTVSYALYPQDWRFAPGHRIALALSGSDSADWFTPGVTQADVEVTAGTLGLPLLRHPRSDFISGGVSDGMGTKLTPPAGALQGATVAGFPPAQVPRPAAAPPAIVLPGQATKARAGVRSLRVRVTGRGSKRRIVATGRATGSARVRVVLRFGRATLARRTARVRRGSFRVSFPAGRLRSGRAVVSARSTRGGRTLRASARIR